MSTLLSPAPVPTRRRVPAWLAILAASLPMFMATLDNLVMTNALPSIRLDLGANVEDLQWFVNAYTLAFASFILTAVALGDRYGRRTVFIVGIVIFTVGSALSALSYEPGMLVASRALQGFGAAAVMPLSLTLLVGSVSQRLRPLAIGVWGGISGLGIAAGPIIGGAVVQQFTWEAIFWINVPIGILSVPLALAALPNSVGARVRADLPGLVLSGLGVLGVIFGIVRGNGAGWDSPQSAGSLGLGVLLLVAFVLWERRSAAPLLPMRLFRDRSFSTAAIVGLTFNFGVFGAIFILIQFLQIVQGYSPLGSGLATMPWTMAPLVVAPLAGLAAPRVGTRAIIVSGLLLQAAGLTWIAITLSPTVPYLTLLPAFILAGVGMGLVFSPISAAILATLADADHAKASGTSSTVSEIGVALGIAVLTAVFVGAGGQLTATGYVHAAIPAVFVGAGVVALAALIALALPAGRGVPHGASD